MKILLSATAILFISIFAVSCDKEKDGSDSVNARIQHQWTFVKEVDKGSGGGTAYIDTLNGVPGDYYDFRTNQKLIITRTLIKDTFDYQLINNNSQVVKSNLYSRPDTFDIQVLTNTTLQLYNKVVSGPQIAERTVYLSR